MRIIDRNEWRTGFRETTVEGALLRMATDQSNDHCGALETVERDLEALRNLVVSALAKQITTVEQLNELAGHQRFLEMYE